MKRPDMQGKNHWFYGKKRPDHSKWMKENHPFKNKHHTKSARKRISDGQKKRFQDPEQRKKMSESVKKVTKKICPYCNREFYPGNFAKYHGEKCKEKK